MRRRPGVTVPEIAAALGISQATAERAVRRLKAQNRVRRQGPNKGGHWIVL